MNNNILKSLRQAMFCTAAAAIVSIGFTACADDTFMTQNTTAPADGYKVSIPANIGSGGTRAIAYNSETGGYDATFETTDAIFVYYKTNESSMFSRVPLRPDANGKSANLVGELAFYRIDGETHSEVQITPAVNDNLILLYKASSFNYSKDFSYDAQESDYAIATVKITNNDNGAITTEPATFQNLQSIYKINFKGIGSDVKIKKVTISSKQEKLVCEYVPTDIDWPNRFSPVSYIYDKEGTDQHELIFMLRFVTPPYQDTESTSGDVISFVALGSDGRYYKGTKSVTTDLENGKYYQAEVAMEDAGLAMTLINNKTGESVLLSNRWTSISTKEAGYTATNTAINTSFEWYGGDQALTLKGVSVNSNNYSAFIEALSDYDDPDNTKVHKLVLDGVNTLNTGLRIGNNYNSSGSDCSLIVSALSGGQLDITSGGIYLGTNATMTIESGEVSVDDLSWDNDGCSVILSGDAKLRVRGGGDDSLVKAADGYALSSTTDGDYTVYTVTAAN